MSARDDARPALSETAIAGLPAEVRSVLRAYLADLAKLFGDSLEAVLLYGSAVRGEFLPGRSNLNLLVLLAAQDVGLLQRYAKIHRRWSREQIAVPLLLTKAELAASLGLFPLEYLEIREHHRLLTGRDPFPDLPLDLRRLPEQCERELWASLLRVRQRFVEGTGSAEAAVILLTVSVTSLLACLRGVARLLERARAKTGDELLADLQAALGLDLGPVREVLDLKRGRLTPGQLEVPRLLDRYCGTLQALVEQVGRWRAEGRLVAPEDSRP
ncbi:hypothetical protein [Nitrospira sp. Kam-Ns4a]